MYVTATIVTERVLKFINRLVCVKLRTERLEMQFTAINHEFVPQISVEFILHSLPASKVPSQGNETKGKK
jgi:hypothetical protein